MYNYKSMRDQGEFIPGPFYSPDGQGKLVIPEGVTEIGASQIENRDKIVSVEFPSTLQKIEARAFQDCTALVSVDFRKCQWTLKSIGNSAFVGCTQLGANDTVVFVPKCRLCEKVFSGCTALKVVVLENTSIPNQCFAGCTSLEVVQARALRTVGIMSFCRCPKINESMFRISNYKAKISRAAFLGG